MKPSASLKFPFKQDVENNCLKRAHTVEETILSAVRLYLVTRSGSRLGNMVGSILPDLLYQLIPHASLTSFADEIKRELEGQFKGVQFLTVTLTLDYTKALVNLILSIKMSVLTSDSIVDLDVALPSIFSPAEYNSLNRKDL